MSGQPKLNTLSLNYQSMYSVRPSAIGIPGRVTGIGLGQLSHSRLGGNISSEVERNLSHTLTTEFRLGRYFSGAFTRPMSPGDEIVRTMMIRAVLNNDNSRCEEDLGAKPLSVVHVHITYSLLFAAREHWIQHQSGKGERRGWQLWLLKKVTGGHSC